MNILCVVGIMVSIIIFIACVCMATSSPSPLGGEIAGMVLSAILFFVCFLLLIYNLGKTKETIIRIDDNQFVEKTESGSEISDYSPHPKGWEVPSKKRRLRFLPPFLSVPMQVIPAE